MKRILVVAAHLDDETFGLGGTLYRLRDNEVRIISLCHGRDDENRKHRIQAAHKVRDILSCDMTVYQNYDMELENLLLKDISKIIEGNIQDFNPDVVFTVSESDIHQDHQLVSKACKIAARPKRSSIKELYEFKIPGCQPYGEQYYDTVSNLTDEEFMVKIDLAEKYSTESMPVFDKKEYLRTIYREF